MRRQRQFALQCNLLGGASIDDAGDFARGGCSTDRRGDRGILQEAGRERAGPPGQVAYPQVKALRDKLLRRAFENFRAKTWRSMGCGLRRYHGNFAA